ncbi:dGTPase [Thorsellia anophelis]|uniref:Deoxyguanosinetriphosphate triphosphohydrolase n=1 Tax=Thorsellia anophelis DSM 18579 TaxID=1123402 RepID=A0A1I0F4C6_9GAMM|nr:dGTPase [Thorsellia anophelis]SET52783.1 dGTPase [Thorsellia anophelis DSM 18579]
MAKIDFSQKLSYQRLYNHKDNATLSDILREFESDRGRIINSAAIRRLQQKTQVFPLERNAAVRSRLTHSMEVQQIGRYIAKEIVSKLTLTNKLKEYKLEGLESGLESLVEMACLMHDIGNPPFGHFGEAAINNWFEKKLSTTSFDPLLDNTPYLPIQFKLNDNEGNLLKEKLRLDLMNFEGNAQGIRIVHSLQKLNLTYAQIGSILKYTRPAYFPKKDIDAKLNYLMKKPGFYFSEEAFVKEIQKELNIDFGHRYFITYIMEAADDISYCIADLEDAVEKNILTVEQLFNHLEKEWLKSGELTADDLFSRVVKYSYESLQSAKYRTHDTQFFMRLRVKTISNLVRLASNEFINHLPEIFEGKFNRALLEGRSEGFRLLSIFKNVAYQYVFTQSEVEELELQGYRVITGLLDIYSPLLDMPTEDFLTLIRSNSHRDYLIETRLLHKLSSKHCFAYLDAIENLEKNKNLQYFEQYEFYYRVRLIQDYISGMTDLYAYDEYRHLMVTG